tara:strand:+ start:13448 stop:14545 length:1098 start_codon:yes stop_codon:yes gene_type:complete
MKIAIIADSIDTQQAGIYQYTLQMTQSLALYDKKNEYFLIHSKEFYPIPNLNQVLVRSFGTTHKLNPFRLFFDIPKTIKELEINLVIEPAHFGPFNLPNYVKRITVIHDLTPLLFPKFHTITSIIAHKLLLKHIIKKTNRVIVNSQNTESDVQKLYPKAKTKLIYPGKDVFFSPNKDSQILDKYKITLQYILSVGTIEPRKNHLVLLKAYEKFRYNYNVAVKLVIVGGYGWKNTNFFKALDKHPYKEDILLLGYVSKDDLRVLYSMAKLMIYPSFYEGFGFPILEAMSCGCPVIAGNNSSLLEVGGRAAEFFDAESALDLSKKIEEILSDMEKLKEMSKKGLTQSNQFSWKRFSIQMSDVFTNLF